MYVVVLTQSSWGRRFKSRDGLNRCVNEWIERVSIIISHWSFVIQLGPVLRTLIQLRQPFTVRMLKSLWSVGVIAWACAFRQGFEPLFVALKSILKAAFNTSRYCSTRLLYCPSEQFSSQIFQTIYISYRNEDRLFSSIFGNRYQDELYSILYLILSQWPSHFYITQSYCLKDLKTMND